ncbi:MBOAT, membrane-bound O-acyltransferase family-domain-containing protein [Neohortaea acidophila]|uniref:O-acyltransferase n=1 Tax=Neohortaea acidophila TaxID=245834 RepID=A0A6A6PNP7_9PEZI|nr:MBOAT, membrane-bound O-acyltransferase family-domain-containing protein [Neohortaea acidophila]KAF2481699.1 MBOAT, membrane-bound O-acyltransferase family-domain-containing protein [Neohortaea acidophila]
MASRTAPNRHGPESIEINGEAQPLAKEAQERSKSHGRVAAPQYKHTFAVHSAARTSCLSHDATVVPSFLGFRNLMGLVLVVSNLRLMIENFKKYGILVTLSGSNIRPGDWRWAFFLYLLTPCHLFIAYIIEILAARAAKDVLGAAKRSGDAHPDDHQAKQKREAVFATWKVIANAHAVNATFMLVVATWVVYYKIHNPGIGTFSEFHAVIVWLKVCSYALTNRDLRRAMLDDNTTPAAALPDLYKTCPYPTNITLKNLSYFWFAPTLVYQPIYPMNSTRRWDFILKRMGEFFLLCVLIWIATAQYAVPLLNNSLEDISQLNLINMIERVLKLSTISLVCWLAGFFAIFQSFLNGLAELMYFADREFYTDWWNVSTVRVYWTSWNRPVTNFMKRHVYAPMVSRGVPSTVAQILTFLFSGFLHELLVGVPTHNLLFVAFFGMLLQLPLIFLTDPFAKMKGHNAKLVGNLIFWFFFCVFGQPIAAMAYFFAWQAKYGVESRPTWPLVMGNDTKT